MKWWISPLILAVQVAAYGLIEGSRPADAGNALLYFLNWFHESALHGAPMILIALGMGLTGRAGGMDVSIASIASLCACVMTLLMRKTGATGMNFWWIAFPAALGAAAILGGINGLLIRSVGVSGVILTALTAAAMRWGGWKLGGGQGLLIVPGYEQIAMQPLPLILILGTMALGWVGREAKLLPWILGGCVGLAAAMIDTSADHAVNYRLLLGAELASATALVLAGGARASMGALLLGALNVAVLFEGARAVLHRMGLAQKLDASTVLTILMIGLILGLAIKDRKLRFLK